MNSKEKKRETIIGYTLFNGRKTVMVIEIRLPRKKNLAKILPDSRMLSLSLLSAKKITTVVTCIGIRRVSEDHVLSVKTTIPQIRMEENSPKSSLLSAKASFNAGERSFTLTSVNSFFYLLNSCSFNNFPIRQNKSRSCSCSGFICFHEVFFKELFCFGCRFKVCRNS